MQLKTLQKPNQFSFSQNHLGNIIKIQMEVINMNMNPEENKEIEKKKSNYIYNVFLYYKIQRDAQN